ncbi:MAG: TolB family protein [Gemmatimonadota bacterium]
MAPSVRLLYTADGGGRAGIRFLVAREGNEIALTRGSADASPVYDPASGWVVFASRETGSWDLWRVRLSGEERTRLTSTPGVDERWPAVSPDGRTLFFTSTAGGAPQIHRSALDGSGASPLTSGPAPHSRAAPDSSGARLAALEGGGGESDGARLVWVDAASGAVSPVPGTDGAPPLGRPAVRRDGTLAYACPGEGGADVCVVSGGESAGRLVGGPGAERDPAWSPDGARLVFSSDREDGNVELYTSRADGSDVRRLTEERGMDAEPFWVP